MSSCEPVVDAGQQLEELQRVLERSEAFLADLELRHARCEGSTGAGDNLLVPAKDECEEVPEQRPIQKKGSRGLSSFKSKLTKWFSSRRVLRTTSSPAETPERRLSFSRVNLEFPGEPTSVAAPATSDDNACEGATSVASVSRQHALSLSAARAVSLGRGVSFITAASPKFPNSLSAANRPFGTCGSGTNSGLCSPTAVLPPSLQLSRAQVPDVHIADVEATTEAALPRRPSVTIPATAFPRARAVQISAMASPHQQLQQHPSQRRVLTDSLVISPTGQDSGSLFGSPPRSVSMRRRASAEVVPVGEQLLRGGGGSGSGAGSGGVYGLPKAWAVYDRVVVGGGKYSSVSPLATATAATATALAALPRAQQLEFEFSTADDAQQRGDAAVVAAAGMRAMSLPTAAHRALVLADGVWYGTATADGADDAGTPRGGAHSASSSPWVAEAETLIPGTLPVDADLAMMVDGGGGGGASTASRLRPHGATVTGGTSRPLSQMQVQVAGSLSPLSQVQLQTPGQTPGQLRSHRARSMQQSFVPSPEAVGIGRTPSKLSRRSSLDRPLQALRALPGSPDLPTGGAVPNTAEVAQVRRDVRRQTWNNEVFVPVAWGHGT